MVKPVVVTVIPLATSLLANVPVAPLVPSVTVSPLNTPTRDALPVFRVAVVVLSYTLLLAVTPLTVRPNGVIFALVVGWVRL